MTHKIAKIWNRVSYETMIFIAFLIRFLSTRALDLDTWSSAWDAMDYSMGNGSRLLIGSIYKLFYGDYLDVTVAYICRNRYYVDDSGAGDRAGAVDTVIAGSRSGT